MFKELSLLNNKWSLKNCNERQVLTLSQRNKISPILAKLLTLRNVQSEDVENYLNLNLYNNLPNPFLLKDMKITIDRVIQAIEKKEVIGTSAIIVKDGGIAYHKPFGMADVEDTIKMETNTIVAIASMSKLMTTAGALILFDKGL